LYTDNHHLDAGKEKAFNYKFNYKYSPKFTNNVDTLAEAQKHINVAVTQLFYTMNMAQMSVTYMYEKGML